MLRILFLRFLCLYFRSLRIKCELPQTQEFILALWHQDLVCAITLFRTSPIATLVSKSQDGQILTDILSRFGFSVYRGSSSNHFVNLRKLLSHSTAIWAMALDGPRGPALVEKGGAEWLALQGKRPIYRMQCTYSNAIRLKTWDRFYLPMPFSTIRVDWSFTAFTAIPKQG